ncbi:hypothetical protein BDR26DRAFT_918898 [Obelidium mucronatum]|nr:hypothetical protein BDR26DRAFT_918898 [Obelidium mucronatum]
MHSQNCFRCRRQKKKCDRRIPSCGRCERTHLTCQYPNLPTRRLESPEIINPNQQIDLSADFPIGLRTIFDAALRPLEEHTSHTSCWIINNPDLQPTFEDWLLVYAHFTKNHTVSPIFFSNDRSRFLDSFFQQPAPIRLIQCAIAAFHRLYDHDTALSYYSRARKAVLLAASEPPSFETCQALYFTNLLAHWKGQPDIGKPFLAVGLEMAATLQLDVDPDESPWLYHLNLSERQKEERRRLYWSFYWYLSFEQATSSEWQGYSFRHQSSVKPPTQPINDPLPVFTVVQPYECVCELYNLIGEIKRHHSSIPKSIKELLEDNAAASFEKLHSRLISIHSRAPAAYILISESAESISTADHARFVKQLRQMTSGEISYAIGLNLDALASISILHRPRLFLTMLKSYTPLYLSLQHQQVIVDSIKQCLESAYRIVNFLDFLLTFSSVENQENIDGGDQSLARDCQPFSLNVYPAFEAMLVFWFIACKMKSMWKVLVDAALPLTLIQQLQRVVEFVERETIQANVSKANAGTFTPISEGMKSMLLELSQDTQEKTVNVDVLELALRVVSLDGVGNEDGSGDVLKEPHCYLGLLGLEVAGGIRWKGRCEESWRLFWKLHS